MTIEFVNDKFKGIGDNTELGVTLQAAYYCNLGYELANVKCPGDASDTRCFFCKSCVLSYDERCENLREWLQI